MRKIDEVFYSVSQDTGNGLEIEYKDISKFLNNVCEIKNKQISDCVLFMLKYCLENAGKEEVDINEKLNEWINLNQ